VKTRRAFVGGDDRGDDQRKLSGRHLKLLERPDRRPPGDLAALNGADGRNDLLLLGSDLH